MNTNQKKDLSFTIMFGRSSSKNYNKAVRLAKNFTQFIPITDSNKLNTIKIAKDELIVKYETLNSLWQIIYGWKTTELLLNSKAIEINELREILKVLECCSNYKKAIIPDEHCKLTEYNVGWGCKFLKTVNRYPANDWYSLRVQRPWYKFGQFKTQTIWEINKENLLAILQRESQVEYLELCDVFDVTVIENAVNSLPDVIDTKGSEKWEITYEDNIDGSIIESKPVGIRPKSSEGNERMGFGVSMGLSMQEEAPESEKSARYIPPVSFDDIGGIDDIIQKIREVIELPLKHPSLFKYLGITPHKGILLFGEPGCGKTLIAKAIANEVNAHFISIKGPELLSKWHGQSEENLRNIFHEAKSLQPSIIFFDEIDSIAQKRSDEESVRLDSKFVNQLLTLMDGFEEYSNVCVIASTNRSDLIDDALLRPGRFDYHLQVNKPTKQGCSKIISIHTKGMPLAEDFNLDEFSEQLQGLTGAEIAFVVREAAFNCLRRNFDVYQLISKAHIDDSSYNKLSINEFDFSNAMKTINN